MPDISDTLKADSTQLNAIDFTGGPRTYTVASVRVVKGDQPVNIRVVEDEDGREYRPSKSMRRALARVWGADSDKWTGRRLTLYCDPAVKWGGKPVGGIKISHVSHIDGPLNVAIQESSTTRSQHKIEPLPDEPTAPTLDSSLIESATTVDELRAMWSQANAVQKKRISERVEQINGEQGQGELPGAGS